jgi:hypothetical protein
LTFDPGSGYRLYVFLNGAARAYTYDNSFVPGGTQWLHVAVVYNGAGATDAQKLQIYVNGVNQVWGYLNTPLPASLQSGGASVFQFGCVSNHGSWGSSTQDEVRVYTLAKTAAQIAADYNSGLGSCGAGAEAGLWGGWHLDEGSGSTAADYGCPASTILAGRVASRTNPTGVVNTESLNLLPSGSADPTFPGGMVRTEGAEGDRAMRRCWRASASRFNTSAITASAGSCPA